MLPLREEIIPVYTNLEKLIAVLVKYYSCTVGKQSPS